LRSPEQLQKIVIEVWNIFISEKLDNLEALYVSCAVQASIVQDLAAKTTMSVLQAQKQDKPTYAT